jgi:membrane-associated phospholipid phosphatase
VSLFRPDLFARVRATRERMPWWSSHLLAVGVFLIILAAFLRLTLGVFEDARVTSFDAAVMRWVVEHRTEQLNKWVFDITALGSVALVTLFAVGALFVLVVARDFRGALHLLIALLGSTWMLFALKDFLARPRPIAGRLIDASGYSYPSGHSMSAAVLYVTLALVGSRHFKGPAYRHMLIVLAVFVTALVAASRVYLGVHYPTDVTSGTVLGAGWAVLVAGGFAYVDERLAQIRAERERAGIPPGPG